MDYSCHKCGYSIEEGRPFCSQCGAPQIRVAVPDSMVPAVAGSAPPAELPTFSLNSSAVPHSLRSAAFPHEIEWRRAFWVSAAAALLCVIVMSIRLLNPLLAVLGAGFLAVMLYYRRNPTAVASARSGAKIGAMAGFLSSVIPALCFAIFVLVLHSGGEVRQEMMDSLQQFASRSGDPQVQATLDLLKTPEGLSKLILAMVGFFLISVAIATLAGASTGAVLKRRNQR